MRRGRAELPERGIACWFGDVVRARTASLRPTIELPTEHGPHPDALATIVAELDAEGVPHDLALTWTTDGLFRETRARVAQRRDQGCLTVEMEAAALFAVAMFRGHVYGQLLDAGDDVSADEWDHRGWDRHTSVRERLLALACGAALRL